MPWYDCLALRQALGIEQEGPRRTSPIEKVQPNPEQDKWGAAGLSLLDELPGSTRDSSLLSHYQEVSSPHIPVPQGDRPSVNLWPAWCFLLNHSMEAEPLCQGSSFLGKVVVGLTRGRAVGGTSGPLFSQLPFPGVSPQPPKLPLSVTLHSGEIRRDRVRDTVSCR